MMPLAPPLLPFGIAGSRLGAARFILCRLIPFEDFDSSRDRLRRGAGGMEGADHVGDQRHGVTRTGDP
jgi:hypothetical protein